MTVKLSRDPGTLIKYPSLHSFVEQSRDPGTKTTVIYSSLRRRIMSHIMTKADFFICKNKGPDQLHCNPAADQCLCFRYIDSKIPVLHKSEISSL